MKYYTQNCTTRRREGNKIEVNFRQKRNWRNFQKSKFASTPSSDIKTIQAIFVLSYQNNFRRNETFSVFSVGRRPANNSRMSRRIWVNIFFSYLHSRHTVLYLQQNSLALQQKINKTQDTPKRFHRLGTEDELKVH